MRFFAGPRGRTDLPRLLVFLLATAFLAATYLPAEAKGRHALLVGVGEYKASNGIESLLAPVNDVEELRIALEHPAIGFEVEILKDADLPNKQTFNEALSKFLSHVEAGDDVLFYFSGHGYFAAGKGNPQIKGNFLLLGDAKSQPAYLIDLPKQKPLEARELDTLDKKIRAYETWLSEIALSEQEIEDAISARKPAAIILIADANRTLVSGSQDAAIVSGLVVPKSTNRGVFKLYSAGRAQAAFERPEEIDYRQKKAKQKTGEKETGKANVTSVKAAIRRSSRKITSLFTRELIRSLPTPRLDISLLHAKVRHEVREEARKAALLQVPAYSHDDDFTPFRFWVGEDEAEIVPRCFNAKNELDALRYGVLFGIVSRADIELKRVDLAPCGLDKVVEAYLRLKQQGAGEGEPLTGEAAGSNNSGQLCDELAASRFDKSRPEDIAGSEIQNAALTGLSGEQERTEALKVIGEAIAACDTAVTERSRVSRFKYNLARANYALAVLSEGPTRSVALAKTSKWSRDASELGHPAAYHLLATLHINGELFSEDGKPQPPDRQQGWQIMQRGADLGHVLALYELGLAYKNGDLELDTDILKEVKSDARAYPYFARAAESGFLPAMIETATALRSKRGVDRDTNRAIQILTLAASRGSPEAMYRLAWIYEDGGFDDGQDKDNKIEADPSEATLWYSRAAEFGDVRAQERLAEKLNEGYGLPTRQPETAARYWRLAADGGSRYAQMQLANLLRDSRVPFRLKLGKQDAGAEEIRNLYLSAFARGNPVAGTELAKLYRTGFPLGTGSDAIPKDPKLAVALLWETMTRVRLMPDDNLAANPIYELDAAIELIAMYDAGEASDPLITADQISELRADFGDPAKAFWIRADALGNIQCSSGPGSYRKVDSLWVRVWDSLRLESPTDRQFDWYEMRTGCKQRLGKEKGKRRELGISKKIRDQINREYDAAVKEREKNPDTYKRFTDRVADLMSKLEKPKK